MAQPAAPNSIVKETLQVQDPPDPGLGRSWLRCSVPLLDWGKVPGKRKALVRKDGTYRMVVIGLGEHTSKYLVDIFITLIDLSWPILVFLLFSVYLFFVLVFAAFWWIMAANNGDFEQLGNKDHDFCLNGVDTFVSVLMFSVETQTTVGYGFSYPNAHCAATVPFMYLQVLVGLLLETLMLGSVFVKIARPKHRANTILFSRHAVVNSENGKLVLQVRIGDLRKSHLVDSFLTGMVIRRYSTKEGVVYPLYQFQCPFTAGKMGDRMFLLFPVIVKHVIDKESPLYEVSPADLETSDLEIVLYLTGTVESTGEMCQARTSYLPGEILWGHQFQRIEEFDVSRGYWRVNFQGFDNVAHCQNLAYSAAELDRMQKKSNHHGGSTPSPGTPGGFTSPLTDLLPPSSPSFLSSSLHRLVAPDSEETEQESHV